MNKIPLILIPGLLCDHGLWDQQLDALAAVADCLVTEKHMHYETIGQIADAIVAEAPARFALSGLSMGGYIALEIYRKYGDRVVGLALLDTSARPDTQEQKDRRHSMMGLCREQKFNKVLEMLFSVLVHPDRQEDSDLKRRVFDMAARTGPGVFLRQQCAIISRIDQRPNLSKISCPTTIICGQQDRITPLDCANEISGKIVRSNMVSIKECGHLSTMEKPEEVTKILYQWVKQIKILHQ